MKSTQTLSILALILTLLLIKKCQMASFCKMTNAVCESSNQSWVTVDLCRLRAISRNRTTLNIQVTLMHPAKNIFVKLQLKKKANGYKPWLFDNTIDACAFMRYQRNPVFKMFWHIIRDFSSVNHTCPYEGTQILKDFYYDTTNFTLPLPSGEYLLLLTWLFDQKPQFVTNVYFSFHHDKFID